VAETAETAEAEEAAAGIINPRTAAAAAAMTGVFNMRRMALLTCGRKASPMSRLHEHLALDPDDPSLPHAVSRPLARR
jgi:hypothetical protein